MPAMPAALCCLRPADSAARAICAHLEPTTRRCFPPAPALGRCTPLAPCTPPEPGTRRRMPPAPSARRRTWAAPGSYPQRALPRQGPGRDEKGRMRRRGS
ncbi:hypothetical protein BRADI_1g56885v3 [Brachypodium distachyon]|uniref:Uncharacterized protein n=1 Tax=Brachypodium distachyon TaxID=15368 RepID=A0A0Q3HDB3_BRADI|nr:hypothetical protein BRADI_1g56885v3 [Brachypodium distachyon]